MTAAAPKTFAGKSPSFSPDLISFQPRNAAKPASACAVLTISHCQPPPHRRQSPNRAAAHLPDALAAPHPTLGLNVGQHVPAGGGQGAGCERGELHRVFHAAAAQGQLSWRAGGSAGVPRAEGQGQTSREGGLAHQMEAEETLP